MNIRRIVATACRRHPHGAASGAFLSPDPPRVAMGFGSYDESEQEDGTESDLDEEDAVSVHETTHDGDVEVEGDASSEELVERLQDIK